MLQTPSVAKAARRHEIFDAATLDITSRTSWAKAPLYPCFECRAKERSRRRQKSSKIQNPNPKAYFSKIKKESTAKAKKGSDSNGKGGRHCRKGRKELAKGRSNTKRANASDQSGKARVMCMQGLAKKGEAVRPDAEMRANTLKICKAKARKLLRTPEAVGPAYLCKPEAVGPARRYRKGKPKEEKRCKQRNRGGQEKQERRKQARSGRDSERKQERRKKKGARPSEKLGNTGKIGDPKKREKYFFQKKEMTKRGKKEKSRRNAQTEKGQSSGQRRRGEQTENAPGSNTRQHRETAKTRHKGTEMRHVRWKRQGKETKAGWRQTKGKKEKEAKSSRKG